VKNIDNSDSESETSNNETEAQGQFDEGEEQFQHDLNVAIQNSMDDLAKEESSECTLNLGKRLSLEEYSKEKQRDEKKLPRKSRLCLPVWPKTDKLTLDFLYRYMI